MRRHITATKVSVAESPVITYTFSSDDGTMCSSRFCKLPNGMRIVGDTPSRFDRENNKICVCTCSKNPYKRTIVIDRSDTATATTIEESIKQYNEMMGITGKYSEHWQPIVGSIRHWDKMIACVGGLRGVYASPVKIKEECGESYFAEDCPLCRKFWRDTYENCGICPLAEVYGPCGYSSRNKWRNVKNSKSNEEWLANAREFLAQLEDLLA